MRGNFEKIVYFIGGVCIIALILFLFPYILLFGVIAYLLIKVIAFFNKDKAYTKTSQVKNNEYTTYKSNEDEDEDEDIGEIIDVEYEEVDKK
ncbi:hypothetical protein [Clostridium uliginosum]|uniref:DUF4834 domain-containing protein n=1 Tax=Clostridium uliginosum TaxID=119641 RepID=A0A1I1RLU3_9CLOT|nr:hypothetical protein [Clostridium uliginosum]SFD34987.1 hypothetical protein SAMN05421842_13512 [Clostridium uliginosum]